MTRMTPSEAFVETMVANGVTTTFGIMGSAFMDAMDIFTPAGIRLVPVVHEQGAAHMADGYARVSGRHGVVIGQNGPGISNCVTAIAAAFWAHSPVVIVTPETGTMGIGLGGFQEANQLPMFEEFTKYQGHVNNEHRMAEITARCFDRAMSELGPTQLNIPRDRFYGDIDVEIPEPMVLDRGAGGERSLNEAAELLASAEFPVILSGGGVVQGDAVPDCIALAERIGAPVVNSYLHNDSFPASHPQWCGALGYQGSKAAMKLIAKADVVVALGSRLGPFGTLPQHGRDYWPNDAKIIQIDADNKMLGLVKKISVGIHGDAGAAARALIARLDGVTLACDATRDARMADMKAEKDTWEAECDEWTHERDDFSLDMIAEADAEPSEWLHPRMVLRELERAMPARAMVSTDIGNIN
ncbi:MAG: sulfoacetaldehyde acetyltransferase, partial [Ilumatobacteraceae bacterium]